MKICIISDTHNKHKYLKLPKADMIIHCGDFTSVGKRHEVENFMKWYSNLDYKHKILIAGNHDWYFELTPSFAKELIPDNVIYLQDSEIIIDGIKFYGTPVSKPFGNWAFNRNEEKLIQHWQAIPDDVDVLITHTPPYGMCDYVDYSNQHEGSKSLYNEIVNRIKPKINCFGHIHESYGIMESENVKFINASNADAEYVCINEPILINL